LINEAKKMKQHKVYDAVIFGVIIGIAIYSSINNGFGLLIFLSLFYVPIAAKNKIKNNPLLAVSK